MKAEENCSSSSCWNLWFFEAHERKGQERVCERWHKVAAPLECGEMLTSVCSPANPSLAPLNTPQPQLPTGTTHFLSTSPTLSFSTVLSPHPPASSEGSAEQGSLRAVGRRWLLLFNLRWPRWTQWDVKKAGTGPTVPFQMDGTLKIIIYSTLSLGYSGFLHEKQFRTSQDLQRINK